MPHNTQEPTNVFSLRLRDKRVAFVEKISSVPGALLLAFILTLFVNGLLVLNNAYNGPDDDLGISTALSCYYPNAGLCLFTNGLLNHFVVSLGQLFPFINAFLAVERATTLMAFFAVAYLAFRSLPFGVAAGIEGFISLIIMPACTVASNFTVVAAFCLFGGCLSFCYGIHQKRASALVVGCLFMTLGFMWRQNIAIMCVPFFILCLIALLIAFGQRQKPNRAISAKWMGAGIALLALCLVPPIASNAMLANNQDWVSWKEYSDARSSLVDYPTKPYDEVEDSLTAIGVSEADYLCMVNWITADPDVITPEKMREVQSVANDKQRSSLARALTSELKSLAKNKQMSLLLFAVAVLAIALAPRRSFAITLISLLMAFAACVILRYSGRCPTNVQYSAWLLSLLPVAICTLQHSKAPSAPTDNAMQSKLAAAINLVGAFMLIGCLSLLLTKWGATFDVGRFDQFEKNSNLAKNSSLIQRFSSEGDVYIWDPGSYVPVERDLKYRFLPPDEFFESNTFAGGWTQGSNFMKAHNEQLGVPNPMSSLVERPHTYFVTKNTQLINSICDYLQQHYGKQVSYEIVDAVTPADGPELYVVQFNS